MRVTSGATWGLVLAAVCAVAGGGPASRPVTRPVRPPGPVTVDEVRRLYQERNLIGLQQVMRVAFVKDLPLADRNAIALLAAQNLEIKDYLKDAVFTDFHAFLREKTQVNDPIRIQWGINMTSAALVRDLSYPRLISEPRVIPYLIAALDHPDRGFVGRDCHSALRSLTRHRVGDRYFSTGQKDPALCARIVAWWRDWWKANQDRHPVFDLALEDTARTRVLEILRLIEKEVKPRYWQFGLFPVPKDRLTFSDTPPLYDYSYDPDVMAIPIARAGRARPLTWLQVRVEFGTPPMVDNDPRAGALARRPAEESLRDRVEDIYAERLEGTDVVITVSLATTDDDLAAFTRITLEDQRPGKEKAKEK